MGPKAVRARILQDHGRLRDPLAEIESLAERFEKAGAEVGAELRAHGIAPCEPFAAHLAYEDAQLAPILRAIPGRGDALADRLARELVSFCAYLREDMAGEEANLVGA